MDTKFDKTLEILFELKVSDVMRKEIITLSPDDSMITLKETMQKSRISGIPIVEGDSLVGIISIEDMLTWLSEGAKESTIKEKMTKNPECLYSDQPLTHAVKKFDQSGFGRFPVINRETSKLVGIITKGDIIESTLKKLESEYKEEEIRQYRASHFFNDIVADKKKIFLNFEVAGKDFDKAGLASTTTKKNLKRLGIRPEIIHRVAIASYEAEMNLVIFTDGGSMNYTITENKITLEVKDNGPGIEDIEKAMEPGYTTSQQWVKELGFGAGMGLPNMKKCADKMDIKSTVGIGTSIKITIYTGGINEVE